MVQEDLADYNTKSKSARRLIQSLVGHKINVPDNLLRVCIFNRV